MKQSTDSPQLSSHAPADPPTMPDLSTGRLLKGEPVTVGQRRIQPIARWVGSSFAGDEERGPFVSTVGRLTPLEVRIDHDGVEEVIPIDDPLEEPLRGIFALSGVVSAICIVIMLVARGVARRQMN